VVIAETVEAAIEQAQYARPLVAFSDVDLNGRSGVNVLGRLLHQTTAVAVFDYQSFRNRPVFTIFITLMKLSDLPIIS
jgi:DNA-binding LytR/AlgR family response regulator